MKKILLLLFLFVLFSHIVPELEARNVPIKGVVRVMRKGWKVLFNTKPNEKRGKAWEWLGMLIASVKRIYKRYNKHKRTNTNNTKALKTT